MYDKIREHLGHKIEAVSYADGENVAIECEDCNEVLMDENREEKGVGESGENPMLKARVLTIVTVNDTSGEEVELQVYQHENGGLFGIDASFLTNGGNFELTDPEDDDSEAIILDPFASAKEVASQYKVILKEKD